MADARVGCGRVVNLRRVQTNLHLDERDPPGRRGQARHLARPLEVRARGRPVAGEPGGDRSLQRQLDA